MAKADSTYERMIQDEESRKGIEEEWIILLVTENLVEIMQKHGITRSELAEKLGTSKAFISQLLNGGRNMTIRTLFRLATALESKVHIHFSETVKNSENSAEIIRLHFPDSEPIVHFERDDQPTTDSRESLAG